MVSRRLSATGIRFSVILFPPGSWALLTVGLPNQGSGPRRGYRVPHARAATGVGALYTPGTAVLIPTRGDYRPAPAASQRPVPAPRHTSHRQGPRLTRHQRGFKPFARPVFPSPVAARMERAALGLPPGLRTPPTKSRTTHARVGDRPSSTDLGLHAQLTSVDLQSGSPLNTCDIASHVAIGITRHQGAPAANAIVSGMAGADIAGDVRPRRCRDPCERAIARLPSFAEPAQVQR